MDYMITQSASNCSGTPLSAHRRRVRRGLGAGLDHDVDDRPGGSQGVHPRPEPLLAIGIADSLEPDVRSGTRTRKDRAFPAVVRVGVGDLERRIALLQQANRS